MLSGKTVDYFKILTSYLYQKTWMMQKRHAKMNGARYRRSLKDFYTGSLFLKNYIQSFAKLCKDFTQNIKFTIKYTIKTQSWTLQDWTNPYAEPYYIRSRTLLPCTMQTHPKMKLQRITT